MITNNSDDLRRLCQKCDKYSSFWNKMLNKASIEDLKDVSKKLDFRCAEGDLAVYRETVNRAVDLLNKGYNLKPQLQQENVGQRNFGHQPNPKDNPYNAWYWMCNIKPPKSGPLTGKKIGVKDCIAVAGVPMMCGSKVLEGFVPYDDATVIKRILNAGGEIMGKTTCEDMCLSCTSYCTTYGPVKNPLDPSRVTGGSSSGSAAALLSRDVEMALGSDQGGSIRMPSSCCGLVGLKPTFGLVPFTGCMSMVTCLDHVGPMARNVADCALMLEIIAGFDDCKDSRQPSFPFEVPEYSKQILNPSDNLRIGVLLEGFDVCEPDVIKCIQRALKIIKSSHKFAAVEDVSVPMHKQVSKIYDLVKLTGSYHQYIGGGGIKLLPFTFVSKILQLFPFFGFGIGSHGVLDYNLSEKFCQGLKTISSSFHPNVKKASFIGAYLEDQGYNNQLFAHGSSMAYSLRKAYDKVLDHYDVIILPTTPHTASKIQDEENLRDYLHFAGDLLDNVKSFNITHHPALSLNAGYSEKDNLPVGLQIVGKLFCDSTVLQVAYIIEGLLKSLQ